MAKKMYQLSMSFTVEGDGTLESPFSLVLSGNLRTYRYLLQGLDLQEAYLEFGSGRVGRAVKTKAGWEVSTVDPGKPLQVSEERAAEFLNQGFDWQHFSCQEVVSIQVELQPGTLEQYIPLARAMGARLIVESGFTPSTLHFVPDPSWDGEIEMVDGHDREAVEAAISRR